MSQEYHKQHKEEFHVTGNKSRHQMKRAVSYQLYNIGQMEGNHMQRESGTHWKWKYDRNIKEWVLKKKKAYRTEEEAKAVATEYMKNHPDEILNVYQSNEDKDKLNNALLIELQRVEEYLKVIKESSLEANYLNKQLTRHLQDANEEIVRNRNMATQGINNGMRDYDYSHNRTWRTNTGNGFMQYEK
jgi:hypothetical protein